MARYLASVALGLVVTAAVLAVLWWAAPRLIGQTPPAGLFGLLAAFGILAALRQARRHLPTPAQERKAA